MATTAYYGGFLYGELVYGAGTDPPTLRAIYPPEGYAPRPDHIYFSVECPYGLLPATLDVSAIETGHGQKKVWDIISLGVVQQGWDAAVSYHGATPSIIDVTIRAWPPDLAARHRRIEMVVTVSSTTGVYL